MYNVDIGENYIGAVADQVVSAIEPFKAYVKNALDIDAEHYFNSGVITLNLKKLRKISFYDAFYGILSSYDFVVAPDQDCLNLICKDKVFYYGAEWNKMPAGEDTALPRLVHFNLNMKPWYYDDILYQEYFWDFAKQTPFYQTILAKKAEFTPERKQRDKEDGERLLALAISESENPENYIRSQRKKNA